VQQERGIVVQDLPEDFDWVSVRGACSPNAAFIKLRSQVESDVKQRVAIMNDREKAGCAFQFFSDGWRFWVTVEAHPVFMGVEFNRSNAGIDILTVEDKKVIHRAVLTLSNNGQCKLKIGEIEYDFWQFRKLALEDVLFTSVAKWRSP
jgi:hypothetical protein